MTFTGKEFLEYVRVLKDQVASYNSPEELQLQQAAFRTIASRAYYGAFLKVRNYLGLNDSESGSIHALVEANIRKRDQTTGNRLSALKKERTNADYRINDSFNLKRAQETIRLATKIIEKIEEFEA